MEKKLKVTLLIVGAIATIGIGAGIALFIYNKNHPKPEKEEDVDVDDKGLPMKEITASITQKEYSADRPTLKSDIEKYQTWSNANKGTALKVDGIWGSKSQGAWDSNGKEYLSGLKKTGSIWDSGMKVGQKLWTKQSMVIAYKYPSRSDGNNVGYVERSALPFAVYLSDATAKDWIKAVAYYKTQAGSHKLVKSTVYLNINDISTVAP